MKNSALGWQVSLRELLLITAVVALVIFGAMTSRVAERAKKKLDALIPTCEIKIDLPNPEVRYALGGRFQHTGVIRFPVNVAIPDNIKVRSFLEDPLSVERFAELSGFISLQNDAGVHFVIELPPPAKLPTRPKAPGKYICVIEAFDGEKRIAIAATPMMFVPWP